MKSNVENVRILVIIANNVKLVKIDLIYYLLVCVNKDIMTIIILILIAKNVYLNVVVGKN